VDFRKAGKMGGASREDCIRSADVRQLDTQAPQQLKPACQVVETAVLRGQDFLHPQPDSNHRNSCRYKLLNQGFVNRALRQDGFSPVAADQIVLLTRCALART
jgi:hypothetical protein